MKKDPSSATIAHQACFRTNLANMVAKSVGRVRQPRKTNQSRAPFAYLESMPTTLVWKSVLIVMGDCFNTRKVSRRATRRKRAGLLLVVEHPQWTCRKDRTPLIAVVMVEVAKNFSNVHKVGWATNPQIRRVQSVQKDTPVHWVLQKVAVVHVLKVNLVQKQPLKNVAIVPLGFSNLKILKEVQNAFHAHRGGSKKRKAKAVVLILVVLNPRIVGTMNTGCPTKNNLTKLVVCLAHRVGHVWVQLNKQAFVLCSGGQNAPKI